MGVHGSNHDFKGEKKMQVAAYHRPASAMKFNPVNIQKNQGPEDPDEGGLKDFYEKYQTPIHIAGGALLGAGIAHYGGGMTGTAVMSAAGTGALAGFFASSPQKALIMGGGAVVGAAIATFAGVPGQAVVSAAGTGALIGFLFG